MTESSISENDVLCGRGGATNTHIGNKRFRSIVSEFQEEYLDARKKEKAAIAKRVVQRVHENGGRFLKRDATTDMWLEVPLKKALLKTGQALREGLDVRHKTVRPDKMPRRLSDSSSESPRKRARLVHGKVIQSPPMTSAAPEQQQHTIPDLNDEQNYDQVSLYFAPPTITRDSCDTTVEV
eukprot:scaffold22642_cov134-Cylindrotheca_fusiformis.AAC.19